VLPEAPQQLPVTNSSLLHLEPLVLRDSLPNIRCERISLSSSLTSVYPPPSRSAGRGVQYIYLVYSTYTTRCNRVHWYRFKYTPLGQ
jgi:hypothetical protein